MSNAGTPTEKKSKKLTILLAVVAVVAIMGTGISLYTFFMNREQAPDSKPAAAVDAPYKIFGPLDFTVNLADDQQRRYLKVTMALGYEDKGVAKELEQRSAQVRDLILEVLRNRSADEVSNGKGTSALRDDLLLEINANLSRGEVKEIYFTDFLVQ